MYRLFYECSMTFTRIQIYYHSMCQELMEVNVLNVTVAGIMVKGH